MTNPKTLIKAMDKLVAQFYEYESSIPQISTMQKEILHKITDTIGAQYQIMRAAFWNHLQQQRRRH